MAEANHLLGFVIGTQGSSGTADPTIAALVDGGGSGSGGEIIPADGLVLGDPSAGIGESGIVFELEGDRRDKSPVTGSFTKQAGDFLGESIASLEISIPLKGSGDTSPTVDADYTPDPGIDALWQAAGLTGAAWGSGVGWLYVPASSQICTIKVWVAADVGGDSLAWVLKDCEASVSMAQPPGDVAVATFTFSGTVDTFAEAATPTFDYLIQGSLSAPAVEAVANVWGQIRGFSTATLTIDSEQETIPDSNAAGGDRDRQTGREITWAGTLFGSDGDLDFERAELIRTTAPTAPLTYTIGTAGGGTANAVRVNLTTPECRKYAVNKLGPSYAVDVELRGVSGSANGEFELIYL